LNLEEYHKMHALERKYWWFQGRRRVILGILGQYARALGSRPTVLDIGCGTGMLLEDLEKIGFATGLDFSSVALEYCRNRGNGNLGRADVRYLPIRSDSVDLITALDLIEHIEDDHGLMGEFHRVLKPGGIAIMSVPAHPKLWSGHDVALHHFRRYTKPQFRQLVEGHGLRFSKYSYSMATAYVPAVMFRSVKRLISGGMGSSGPKTDEFELPGPVNALLRESVGIEAKLLKHMNLPFGLSLLGVARKPV